jgi:YidC/Oxa1 family membrane protein insertase
MDRKSWIGIIICFVAMVAWQFYVSYRWPYHPPKKAPAVASATVSNATATTTPTLAPATASTAATTAAAPSIGSSVSPNKVAEPKIPANAAPEQIVELENDVLVARFTTLGAAIKTIELKKHDDEGDKKIVLNRHDPIGIFNLTGWDGDYTQVPYSVEKQGDALVFQRTLPSGLVLKRTFRLGKEYQVSLEQQVSNPTANAVTLPEYRLNVGTAGPIHTTDSPIYIFASYCTQNGNSFHKVNTGDFQAGSFLGFPTRESRAVIASDSGPLLWAAVKNQFFALILWPNGDAVLQGAEMRPVKLINFGDKTTTVPEGVNAEAILSGISVPAGQTANQSFTLYAGPKQYANLDAFDRHQNLVMDSWFGWIVRPLLFAMRTIYVVIPSWGWTIIVMTLLIKGVLWPLQTIANKSMKQMQALQPKMELIRQKYKDEPQKMNTETMALYKEYGVNPAGGCLPMLVQMPIFIGFYVMLQSAVELRGCSFWWIRDLVQPDTVAHIPFLGHLIPVNPLPLLMTGTQVLLMKMTPSQGDNPQMKMMQWMPVVLLFVLYNFAAALALYWTVSNIISMIQTYVNLRKPVPLLKRVPKKKKL